VSVPLYLCDAQEDDARFLPFALSRPLGELRYGAWLLRERWSVLHGLTVAGHLSAPHLLGFTEPGAPPVVPAPGDAGAARLVFRSTFVPAADAALGGVPKEPARLVDDTGTTVGAALPPGTPWPGLAGTAGWPARPVGGRRLEGVWQLIGDLPVVLREDLTGLAARLGPGTIPAGCTVLGDPALVLVEGAVVEPHVVFDVRNGPVWLGPGAEVRAFTRLTGPLAVHAGTRIEGGRLRESSIGPKCVVHGEVSTSLFLGYANKAHDGFLGHSIVGRWANLGAGTITSNLKNTYGPVRLSLGAERIETGLTFLGALIGDHAKTAIGTMLPTGCMIGTGANVFGTKRPEAHVPAFAWGTDEPDRLLACRMFLRTASRVLPRRDVACDDAVRAYLAAVWQAATGRACD
jgi:UDP-N-acetylglucosamine diphosphorylase/glucosamine-1-phosphate N-acetyltransferase